MPPDILAYNKKLTKSDQAVAALLMKEFSSVLQGAECKVWHGHPVWFLDGNPIVGYHRLKDSVRVLFWSGQSFKTPGLAHEGSFKAAEIRYTTLADVKVTVLRKWLRESRVIQWDYKNIVKKKGKLDQLA
ncbi:MAG: hypothetical protein RI911_775 [Candidatus Parcubacteria bacterium]|jgi:hypothetical protein